MAKLVVTNIAKLVATNIWPHDPDLMLVSTHLLS